MIRRTFRIKRRSVFKRNFFILTIVLVIITSGFLLQKINKKISPILINYAEVEIKRFSNLIINQAVMDVLNNDLDINELLIIEKDNSEEIKTIDYNPIFINYILTNMTKNIQVNLKNVIKGNIDKVDVEVLNEYNKEDLQKGIIFKMPSGVVFDNTLLANIGPKIPVRFELVGEVISNIGTKLTNYGINNALVEINLQIELSEQVVLPFISKKITYNVEMPLAIKLIHGKVPNYYLGGLYKNSANVLLPIE